MNRAIQPGDHVVYRMPKRSTRPGARARDVRPARHGDDYAYHVDKYWVVSAVLPDGSIVATTRTGKQHVLSADDPLLRHANWWEQRIHGKRFPSVNPGAEREAAVQ